MMYLRTYLYLLFLTSFLFMVSNSAAAQNLSNRGREFWVGYGHHQFMEPGQNNSQQMVLYFSAEEPANVTVTVRGRTATQVTNYAVPANTVIASNFMPKSGGNDCRLYDVPPSFGGNGGEGIFNLSIHIESDVPIVAYAHTFGSASSGATMLMPVETYGYAYISINSRQVYAANCFSWAYVVASHDNTVVEITPSVLTRLGKPAGVPFTVTLNKGEIYQVIGANPTNSSTSLEVSGTKFRSIANPAGECFPIAAFSGSSRTTNPISCGSGGGDNDNQQLFPTQAWGKRYITAPTSRSTSASNYMTNSYKVLVKDPGTIVTRNGVPLTGLQQGNFYFFESNSADLIEADKPVMVAQFMTGGGCMGGGVGDPEMIYLSPIEQGIKRIGFYRNTRENITVNYLTLIIPTNGLASLRIDGSPAFDHSYPHPRAAGYTVVIKRWTSAQAQAKAYSDSAFTAITYGLGSVESYGYNAGTLINNLSARSSLQNILDNSVPEHEFTCVNTETKLSVLMAAYKPTRIDWQLSQLGTAISPNADITDMSPVAVDTVLVNGVKYYKYELPGNYRFNVADTIDIPIRTYHPSIENCYTRENLIIQVVVTAKAKADFSFLHTGCTSDTILFTGPDTTNSGLRIKDYIWTFPGSVTQSGDSLRKILPPGTHAINFKAVTAEGCLSDTTRSLVVLDRPKGDFITNPPALCTGSPVTFTDTASAQIAINEWYWDYGNGVSETISTGSSATYIYPAYGTYTVKHVARSSTTCVSDTVSRTVNVYAPPSVSFINSANGCLNTNGLVQFNGAVTTPDGQTITSYAWNFGDAAANASNPNTSALQNPTHNFQQGTYVITLTATTASSCTKDTVETITFNLKPQITFAALSPVCESVAPVSVAMATIGNAVPGTGIYSGPGTSASGLFDPSVAGSGTHTIWYKFTTNTGCTDSASQTIQVNAKPNTSFVIPASGCLPTNGLVQFTNTTTIADAQTLSWVWNFGDAAANPSNPNTSTLQNPTHNFAEGTYIINLTATSSNGCSNDTSVTAKFALRPVLTYSSLNAVCEDNPAISVASATVTNTVSGSGIYRGPGVSTAGMFEPQTAGWGTHTLWYVFTTNGGCTDSVSQTIEVHPRPVSPALAPTGGFCEDNAISISSSSTIPTGSITTWQWNLGDGTNVSYSNGNPFTHIYSQRGTYNIQLVTVSNQGCNSVVSNQEIVVNPLPSVDFILPASICFPGNAIQISNQSTVSDNSGLSFTWDYGDGTTPDNNINGSHIYSATGSYDIRLLAVSGNGCSSDTSKNFSSFFTKPVAQFAASTNEICQGEQITFTDGSTDANNALNNWNWSFGDGSSSANRNPVKRFMQSGIRNVSLVVANSAGCTSDPYMLPITVNLQPVVDAGRSFVVPLGNVVTFRPVVNDSANITFSWSPPIGLSNPYSLTPSLIALEDRTYTLTGTGNGGCSASDTVSVKILKPVNIPNAFSPNGDGINDTWIIQNLTDYSGAKVQVFNRYGQLVYSVGSYSNPWDGRSLNGSPLPVGVYYYVIDLQNGFKPLSGSVTILR